MTNKVNIKLEINKKNEVDILIDGKSKKKIPIASKKINTKDIFSMLNYGKDKLYVMDCVKYEENATKGDENESKRLYNYLFDLYNEIIDSINTKNKELQKQEKE